jgi:hypothetical protein
MEWVESCLDRFVANYKELGITSVAMPWLGAMNGGLPWDQVHRLMRSYLSPLDDIDVEIVEYDPDASDPIFRRVQATVMEASEVSFAEIVGITRRAGEIIWRAIKSESVANLSQLIELPGLGKTSVESLYDRFRHDHPISKSIKQQTLFD